MATFSEIVKILYPYYGDGKKEQDFLLSLFRSIVGESVDHSVFDKTSDMLRRIYNGTAELPKSDASFLLNALASEKHLFVSYIETTNEDILTILKTKFPNNNEEYLLADEIADLLIVDLEKLASKTKTHKTSSHMEASEEFASTFANTLDSYNFDNVFREICRNDGILGLSFPNNVHLFCLQQIENNAFDFNDLQQFLEYNVGNYIFSRATLDKMSLNERDKRLIGKKACDLLRANGNFDVLDDEIGDIILYIFLEQVLKAPKIYSQIQLTENGEKTVNRGSVHLLRLTSPTDSYQLVLGKSKIIGDLKVAIDNAFLAIIDAEKNKQAERSRLDNRILNNQSFQNPADIEFLRSVIFPTKEKTSTNIINKAFGVFLGYSLDINKTNMTSEQFCSTIMKKMQADIRAQVAYIIDKIKSSGLESFSFYFYLLPFNNAETDKMSLIKYLLGGNQY